MQDDRPATSADQLDDADRAWILEDMRLRDRARVLAEQYDRDAEDLYRTLRQMKRTPGERLRLGLRHARLHPKFR